MMIWQRIFGQFDWWNRETNMIFMTIDSNDIADWCEAHPDAWELIFDNVTVKGT